ncbi:MAG: GNAT family N-acetyltransferase [Chitinophagaceae bacterium]|nr:MAG: GNAT family N-acetyltransferase [Chitinophagaceae bacterium]
MSSTAANDPLDFGPATPADAEELYALNRAQGGNAGLTPSFFRHWYFANPSASCSVQVARRGGRIEGMATTNNFFFRIGGARRLAAMPQNVLTSAALRGKGAFGTLYFRTEAENLHERGVDLFLTFTNGMSTPIFLRKFGYRRGRCPDVLLYPFGAGALFSGYRFRRLGGIDAVPLDRPIYGPDNAVLKDAAFYRWRYAPYPPGVLHVVEVGKAGAVSGYLVLKKEQKKGIPFLLLMDVIAPDEASFTTTLKAAPAYGTRRGAAFVLLYDPGGAVPPGLHRRIRERFNFLVKGKTPEETETLAATQFRFFFGDMDIV